MQWLRCLLMGVAYLDLLGPRILARSLSVAAITDRHGNNWQYHSRSDRHSKIACWGIIFDLLRQCPAFRSHVAVDKVFFGINHEMRDFAHDRKKNLDLVICTPVPGDTTRGASLSELASHYRINLTDAELREVDGLPPLRTTNVGSVMLALEAKACMTAHQRALPRLYDELNSSHLTIHGAANHAIAAGFVMINTAPRFLSPDLNKANRVSEPEFSDNRQPKSTSITIEKIKKLPRRSGPGSAGFDALAIILLDCVNDGTPANVISTPPAPQAGDIYEYGQMLARLCSLYGSHFSNL